MLSCPASPAIILSEFGVLVKDPPNLQCPPPVLLDHLPPTVTAWTLSSSPKTPLLSLFLKSLILFPSPLKITKSNSPLSDHNHLYFQLTYYTIMTAIVLPFVWKDYRSLRFLSITSFLSVLLYSSSSWSIISLTLRITLNSLLECTLSLSSKTPHSPGFSYLSGSLSQTFLLASPSSITKHLNVGVFQGFVLGAFLFSFNTFSLSNHSSSYEFNYYQYAYASQIHSLIQNQNCCLSSRLIYLFTWHLQMNISKVSLTQCV